MHIAVVIVTTAKNNVYIKLSFNLSVLYCGNRTTYYYICCCWKQSTIPTAYAMHQFIHFACPFLLFILFARRSRMVFHSFFSFSVLLIEWMRIGPKKGKLSMYLLHTQKNIRWNRDEIVSCVIEFSILNISIVTNNKRQPKQQL